MLRHVCWLIVTYVSKGRMDFTRIFKSQIVQEQ